MSYRVVILPTVENQILDQVLYIAQDSIDNALRWEQELHQRIMGLCELPLAHPTSPPESRAFDREVRKMNFGNYLIFYRVDEANKAVHILAFMHGARRLEID